MDVHFGRLHVTCLVMHCAYVCLPACDSTYMWFELKSLVIHNLGVKGYTFILMCDLS